MTDIDGRLSRIEQAHDHQRRAWVAKAAEHAGFHNLADALELLDATWIVTSGGADRAVQGLLEQHPYLGRIEQQITLEEQQRRWGQELLDQINRA
jgi:hypothetical protein